MQDLFSLRKLDSALHSASFEHSYPQQTWQTLAVRSTAHIHKSWLLNINLRPVSGSERKLHGRHVYLEMITSHK